VLIHAANSRANDNTPKLFGFQIRT